MKPSHEVRFLSILRHLLQIDPKDTTRGVTWDTVETAVDRATSIKSRRDAARLLQSSESQPGCYPEDIILNSSSSARNWRTYKKSLSQTVSLIPEIKVEAVVPTSEMERDLHDGSSQQIHTILQSAADNKSTINIDRNSRIVSLRLLSRKVPPTAPSQVILMTHFKSSEGRKLPNHNPKVIRTMLRACALNK